MNMMLTTQQHPTRPRPPHPHHYHLKIDIIVTAADDEMSARTLSCEQTSLLVDQTLGLATASW